MSRYSLRRRLLLWLFIASALLGVMALTDTWCEAQRTAQGVSDRVLAGSALAIAESVSPNANGALSVDIPYSALEMLTSTAQDQVFYRVDGPDGFLTGYPTLQPLVAGSSPNFAEMAVNGVASLSRQVSTGQTSVGFIVTVAESTRARNERARAILIRSAPRLAGLAAAAVIVRIAVTLALRPLNLLGDAIALRSPDDLRAVTADTPREAQGLVDAINSLMQRLDQALTALRNFTGNASHHLRTPLATVRAQPALAMRAKVRGSVSAPPKNRCRPPCHGGADRHRRPRPLPDRRAIALDYEGPVRAIAAAEPVLL
ncbi:MAG: sensor histidine kinase N-terminal domain-containing protein, partial [Candidatus Saccharibacteria bacterium]|nr:sensor histidine kinase N-terminal domain-containing protein [Pseudorhodobacter sp.]